MTSAGKASHGQFDRLLGHIQIGDFQRSERETLESVAEHIDLWDLWLEPRDSIDEAYNRGCSEHAKQVGKGKGKKARMYKNKRTQSQSPDLRNDASCDP